MLLIVQVWFIIEENALNYLIVICHFFLVLSPFYRTAATQSGLIFTCTNYNKPSPREFRIVAKQKILAVNFQITPKMSAK